MTAKLKVENRDPITGEPGSHPIGVSFGTAAGSVAGVTAAAAAGAAAGTVAGPVGVVAGAVIGGIAGAAVGKGIAEAVDPTAEDAYWSENYRTRPYVASGDGYDTYQPAYRYGVDSYSKYEGRRFDEIETDLQRDWDSARGSSALPWDRARDATRDSYTRLYSRKSV